MKQLLSDTLVLAKQVVLLQATREVYVLLALQGATGVVAGLVLAGLC